MERLLYVLMAAAIRETCCWTHLGVLPHSSDRSPFLRAASPSQRAGSPSQRAASALRMRVSSIESTPNPQSFLLRLDEPLCGLEGVSGLRGRTFETSTAPCPPPIAGMLVVDGVESVFAMERAVTVMKTPSAAWESILPLVIKALGGADPALATTSLIPSSSSFRDKGATAVGGITVRMQVSLGVPIQVEAMGSGGFSQRAKLPPRFGEAMALLVAMSGHEFFKGRAWLDRGVRYCDDEAAEGGGDLVQNEESAVSRVLAEEAAEIDAAYPIDRLAAIVKAAHTTNVTHPAAARIPLASAYASPDLSLSDVDQLIESMDKDTGGGESGEALHALAAFVKAGAGGPAARRNALAYLGTTGVRRGGGGDVIFEAVAAAFRKDRSPAIRRTAGDALSDIGDARAVGLAVSALEDVSKLVRWRAARILGEVGCDAAAIAALKQAQVHLGLRLTHSLNL